MGISFGDLLKEAITAGRYDSKKKAKKKAVPPPFTLSAGDPMDLATAGLPVGGPSIESLLRAGQGVGQPLTLGQDYGPGIGPPPAPGLDPATASVRAALERVLASLGGGPDRNAYIAPFDQASARAQQSYEAAVPVIANQYGSLRQGLEGTQQAQQAQAQQVQAQQAAQQAAQQQLLQNLQAPVAADLAAQGGQAQVGSLTGALQASMAAGQAGLGAAGAAQTQLSQNLANSADQSFDSRIEDSRLAETAAAGNASANLNSILNQIGLQKANAERQYLNDSQGFQGQRQQIELQLAQLQDASRQAALQAQDPSRILQGLQANDQLAAYQRQRNAPPAYQLFDTWRRDNPVATSLVENVFGQAEDPNEAFSILAEMARSQAKKNGGQFITYDGKRISVPWIRARLNDLYGGAR